MYNARDIQFTGKHDYDKVSATLMASPSLGWLTFSIGIFKWELKSNGKSMKRGKVIVRVKSPVISKEKAFAKAEEIVKLLDEGKWSGKKSVLIIP